MDLPTQTHLTTLRDLLNYRLRELQAEVHAAELTLREPVGAAAHEVADSKDEAAQRLLSDVDGAQELRDLREMAQVQAALQRLDAATYGDCADCGEQHYHEWRLLRASLQQLLDEGQMRPHEPAFDPDPAHYVTWEYCRGYADAVLSDS